MENKSSKVEILDKGSNVQAPGACCAAGISMAKIK